MRSDIGLPSRAFPSGNSLAVYAQTFNNTHPSGINKWAALSTGVFRANQVLEGLKKVTIAPEDNAGATFKLQIEAQARLLRGAYNFWLVNSFNDGQVIIFDFVPKGPAEFQKKSSPRTEVIEFVKKDLEFAADIANGLPAKWTPAANNGRVTLGTANALLGQLYLFDKNYTKAAEYLKKVIDGPYALTSTLDEIFAGENELSSEFIFEINYSANFKKDKSGSAGGTTSSGLASNLAPAGTIGGFRTVMPPYWLTMAYKQEVMDTKEPKNYKVVNGVNRLMTYSQRLNSSIAVPDDSLIYFQQKTHYAQFNNNEPAYFKKFTNWKTQVSENPDGTNLRRSAINFPIIRLADVYLMYAESLIKGGTGGDVDNAMLYINKVRRRSGIRLIGPDGTGQYPANDHDNITYTAQSLMDHLMYVERPLELSIEGNAIRVIDLRRWGITKQRFQELSLIKYKRSDYVYIDADRNNLKTTKFGAIVRFPTAAELAAPATVYDYDYQAAASNFILSQHGYWPTPANELTSNPNF